MSLLRPRPVTVQVGAVEVTIPARYADEWVEALDAPDPVTAVLAMCDQESVGNLAIGLMVGRVTAAQREEAAYEAIAVAGGRPWWEVMRLALGAAQPRTAAILAGDNVDYARVSLPVLCAAVQLAVERGLDEKKLMQFQFDLARRPQGAKGEQTSIDAVVW